MSKSSNSIVSCHQKLKLFLEKVRSRAAVDPEEYSGILKTRLKWLTGAASAALTDGKPFGLPEALSVKGISNKTIEQYLDESLPSEYVKSVVYCKNNLSAPENKLKVSNNLATTVYP